MKPLGKEKKKKHILKLPVSAQQAKPLLQPLWAMSGNGNCVEMCSSGFCIPGKLSHIPLPGVASKHRAQAPLLLFLPGVVGQQSSWGLIHPSAFLDGIPEG